MVELGDPKIEITTSSPLARVDGELRGVDAFEDPHHGIASANRTHRQKADGEDRPEDALLVALKGCAMPMGWPITLAANPTNMTTVMLKQTARTIRPAVLAGRVPKFDRTAAPGMNSSVTTPGSGAMGE